MDYLYTMSRALYAKHGKAPRQGTKFYLQYNYLDRCDMQVVELDYVGYEPKQYIWIELPCHVASIDETDLYEQLRDRVQEKYNEYLY